MARPTAKQAKLNFEKRSESRVLLKCEIPEVKDALATIRRDAWARWKAGDPVEAPSRPSEVVWGSAEPFWLQIAVCQSNGLEVQIKDRGDKRPRVTVSLKVKEAQKGLAARFEYPQDLVRTAQYDRWEIKRDAPITRILEDVEYQWRQIRDDRDRIEGRETKSRRRGSSTDRRLWAIEAYRRRCEGEIWREIAQRLRKHESTVREAVKDLCQTSGLPWPKKGTVLPDAPSTDCENCSKRRSPSQPCDECPWVAFAEQYLAPSESPGVEREPPGT
jgi:hypothetical protein